MDHGEAKRQLTKTGALRAGINMGNPLLVTGRTADGEPDGVAPDMARALAFRLGIPVKLVPFAKPAEVAAAAGGDAWDICLIGAEPQRADKIEFTRAYVEIEATYLVPAGSSITVLKEVDMSGVKIAVMGGSAFGLWLDRNIKHAELVRADSLGSSAELFMRDRLDALAGLRPGLLKDAGGMPGSRLLDGQFMSVQQAIGVEKPNQEAFALVADFVREAKEGGLVAELIAKHRVVGLSIAAV